MNRKPSGNKMCSKNHEAKFFIFHMCIFRTVLFRVTAHPSIY